LKNDLIYSPIDFCEQQNIFEGPAKIFTFLCGPPSSKIILELDYGPTGIKSSSNEPIRSKEDCKVIWQQTPTNITSPIFFT
jgi:hypothetical protein